MNVAIENTLKDVEKLEEQILSILNCLEKEEFISEAQLLHIPLIPPENNGNQTEPLEGGVADVRKGKGKAKNLTASQLKSKKLEMDSAAIPMDISILDDLSKAKDSKGIKYTLLESSVFLLPIMDTWVFGMTLLNSSVVAINQPEAVLTVIPKETDVLDKPCRVFTYSVQVTPLDVKQGSMECRNVCAGIPFHDTFVPNTKSGGTEIEQSKIQPGCQVLVTATFKQPLGFCGINNDFKLIVSLCLNGIQLLARTFHATSSLQNLAKLNDDVFKKHRVSILTALACHKEYFKIQRILKSPHKAVEKFLLPLEFEKISSEYVGIDTSVEYFASNQIAMLWGLTFKMEKCLRDVTEVRCVVSSRSEQQMQIFSKLFFEWIKKECQHERSKGLKGISVIANSSIAEDKSMTKTLKTEIQSLTELMQLCKKGKFRNASSQMDRQWIEIFMKALQATDAIFMQFMKNIS